MIFLNRVEFNKALLDCDIKNRKELRFIKNMTIKVSLIYNTNRYLWLILGSLTNQGDFCNEGICIKAQV